MPVVHVNYLAVVVAALVAFVIGAVWYSPMLFAKPWTAAHGITTPEAMAAMRKDAPRAYAVSFVCFLVMAVVLDILLARLNVHGPLRGAKVGAFVWLGFAATIGLTANMYSKAPLKLFLIDTGYQLVYLMAMGAVLASWS